MRLDNLNEMTVNLKWSFITILENILNGVLFYPQNLTPLYVSKVQDPNLFTFLFDFDFLKKLKFVLKKLFIFLRSLRKIEFRLFDSLASVRRSRILIDNSEAVQSVDQILIQLSVGQIIFGSFSIVFCDKLVQFVENVLIGDFGWPESFGNGFALNKMNKLGRWNNEK